MYVCMYVCMLKVQSNCSHLNTILLFIVLIITKDLGYRYEIAQGPRQRGGQLEPVSQRPRKTTDVTSLISLTGRLSLSNIAISFRATDHEL